MKTCKYCALTPRWEVAVSGKDDWVPTCGAHLSLQAARMQPAVHVSTELRLRPAALI